MPFNDADIPCPQSGKTEFRMLKRMAKGKAKAIPRRKSSTGPKSPIKRKLSLSTPAVSSVEN
jgi:hypothetical protein